MKAIVGALRVVLGMDSAAFDKGATAAEKRANRLRKSMDRIGKGLGSMGRKLSAGVTAPLVAFAYKSVDAMKAQERAVAAVDAALASMGDKAGFTRDQLHAMASELQSNSLYGDEDILQKVTANLLTFGNIHGEVFERASQLSLDLSARLGTDLQSSAIMLGKALNDPVKGLSALSRVGVSFTAEQEAMIKKMAAAGDAAGAQTVMLKALEEQYRGQAAALAGTDSGRITQAWMAIGDAMEKVGAVILPILAEIADKVKVWAETFQALSPDTQALIVKIGAFAAAAGPLLVALGGLVLVLKPLAGMILAIASPVGAAVIAIGALTFVVWKNWDAIKAWASGVWDRAKELPGRIASALSGAVDLVTAAIGDLWAAIWDAVSQWPAKFAEIGGFLIDGLKQGIQQKIDDLKGWLGGVADGITDVFNVSFLVKSPSRVFAQIGRFLMDGLKMGIGQGVGGPVSAAEAAAGRVSAAVKDGLGGGLFDSIGQAIERMGLNAGSTFEKMGRWLVDLAKGATTLRETLANLMQSWSQSLISSGMSGLGDVLKGSLGDGLGGLVTGLFGGLMGFANGGEFKVGGLGGIDSQIVAFRASPDETVSIKRPDQMGGGAGLQMTYAPVIDARGADQAAVARIEGALRAQEAGFEGRVRAALQNGKMRRIPGMG